MDLVSRLVREWVRLEEGPDRRAGVDVGVRSAILRRRQRNGARPRVTAAEQRIEQDVAVTKPASDERR